MSREIFYFNKKIAENKEQNQAVKGIVPAFKNILEGNLQPPYLVHGPPGTGKSATLKEEMQQVLKLLPEGKKILIAAPSTTAVDLLATGLLEDGETKILWWYGLQRDIATIPESLNCIPISVTLMRRM